MSDIDVNDFLTASGAPTAKFVDIGDTVKGTVISSEVRQQTEFGTGVPLTWDDGRPRLELVVTIDTGDTGDENTTERRLYAKGEMLKAIKQAVKDGGGRLLNGGELTVRYTGDGEQKTKGFHPPKLYKAKYTPPAAAPAPSVADLDDL